MDTMIEITNSIHEKHRISAGKIYYEAFRRKLQPLVGKPAETRQTLTAGFNLDMAIGALADGELLGLAGLHSAAGIFSRVRMSDCSKQLGPLRGFYAWAVLNLFGAGAKCPPGHLRIAAIAVDEKARGKGLGSLMLESIFAKAHREGFKAVRLEVVDTNPRAKKLYQNLGFVVVETHAYPITSGWLGFAKEYVMVKTL
jgi:ribosomal protein S18 acetylase RimI-like enzyme